MLERRVLLPTELSGQGDNPNILKKPPQILSDVFNVFILKLIDISFVKI